MPMPSPPELGVGGSLLMRYGIYMTEGDLDTHSAHHFLLFDPDHFALQHKLVGADFIGGDIGFVEQEHEDRLTYLERIQGTNQYTALGHVHSGGLDNPVVLFDEEPAPHAIDHSFVPRYPAACGRLQRGRFRRLLLA